MPKKSTTRKPMRKRITTPKKVQHKKRITHRKRSVSRVVTATCKKCGATVKFDIGDYTKEEVIKMLGQRNTFECHGHHVELSSPLNYLEFDWGSIAEQHVPTDAEWLAQMKRDGYNLISTDDLRENYTDVNFAMGMLLARRKSDGEKVVLDFTNSPSGKRYYY